MTIIVNVVLALAFVGAIGALSLFRKLTADAVTATQGKNMTAQEGIAAKMTVDSHRMWEVFTVVLMVGIIAGFFIVN